MSKKFKPDYLKAAVYGANDGIITTFAIVAGVSGAGLPARVIIILGIANMVADGISMAAGDFLGERSEQKLRKQQKQSHKVDGLWKTGLITFVAFVLAGSLPLMPYFMQSLDFGSCCVDNFLASIIATGAALFFIGSLRTLLTKGSWIKNGLEMLGIGAIAASVAYGLGALVEHWV